MTSLMPEATAAETPPVRATRELYGRIRADIVHGVMRPNEPVIETELAGRLGVSRTPVREALLRLESDGLVISRRRRWYVYEHTATEIAQIYEVRAANEGYAARLACERADSDDLARIANASTDVNRATGPDRVEANETFHDTVNAACRNPRLLESITKTRLYHFNVRLALAYSGEELRRSSQQHDEIVAAVVARDADAAEAVVRRHIAEAGVIAARQGR